MFAPTEDYLDTKRILLILTVVWGILGLIFFIIFPQSLALGPTDPECYEVGNYSINGECNLFGEPLTTMTKPFEVVFGDFTYVIIWGIIMGVLWLRVQNTMMVGIVGIALAALFTQGFSQEAQIIGYGLLAVAIGVALYQLITVRVHYPSG